MSVELVVYPIVIAVAGGIMSAVAGAYRNTGDKGEEFNTQHFLMAIPRSIVGAVIALAFADKSWDVTTLSGILGILTVGFTANQLLGKFWGNSEKPKLVIPEV